MDKILIKAVRGYYL